MYCFTIIVTAAASASASAAASGMQVHLAFTGDLTSMGVTWRTAGPTNRTALVEWTEASSSSPPPMFSARRRHCPQLQLIPVLRWAQLPGGRPVNSLLHSRSKRHDCANVRPRWLHRVPNICAEHVLGTTQAHRAPLRAAGWRADVLRVAIPGWYIRRQQPQHPVKRHAAHRKQRRCHNRPVCSRRGQLAAGSKLHVGRSDDTNPRGTVHVQRRV